MRLEYTDSIKKRKLKKTGGKSLALCRPKPKLKDVMFQDYNIAAEDFAQQELFSDPNSVEILRNELEYLQYQLEVLNKQIELLTCNIF